MPRKLLVAFVIFAAGLAVPCVSLAGAIISEIMYDLPGTDTGREWIEVQNTGSDEISFLKWKLFEGDTNHGLTLFQGNATTSASGFAVIADDPAQFLIDNPSYTGSLFGSSFSLSNTGEILELRQDGVGVHQATYASTAGATGDGNSLHYVDGSFKAGVPSPGSAAFVQAGSSGASNTQNSNTTTASETGGQSSAQTSSGGTSSSAGANTPQIYVTAIVPTKGTVGAPVLFDATAIGTKKEPITNARYVWSFGDGGTAEGKKIYHTYHYPASYVVMVNASSGEWGATHRSDITILVPELSISNIREGGGGFIELRNGGRSEVDLSFWILKSGPNLFTLPQGTVIDAEKSVPFASAITGLLADPLGTTLHYPNGDLVVTYTQKPQSREPAPLKKEEPKVSPVIVKKVSQEKLAPEPVLQEPSNEEGNATLAIASSTQLLGAVGASGEANNMPWIIGLALLIALSIGGYLMMLRPRPEPSAAEKLKTEAASFDIVEEN